MALNVYVKVVGFRDFERHALNTLFGLSAQGAVVYSLWTPDAPAPPGLALVDNESYEAGLELISPSFDTSLKIICVGQDPPSNAWRTFGRPLHWPDVVHAMDELFAHAAAPEPVAPAISVAVPVKPAAAPSVPVAPAKTAATPVTPVAPVKSVPAPAASVDLEFDFVDTEAPKILSDTRQLALVVFPLREDRMYLRARLALAGLTTLSEAENAEQALDLARRVHHSLVLVGQDLADMDTWELVRQLISLEPAIGRVVLATREKAAHVRQRAEHAGCHAVIDYPFNPQQIIALLQKI